MPAHTGWALGPSPMSMSPWWQTSVRRRPEENQRLGCNSWAKTALATLLAYKIALLSVLTQSGQLLHTVHRQQVLLHLMCITDTQIITGSPDSGVISIIGYWWTTTGNSDIISESMSLYDNRTIVYTSTYIYIYLYDMDLSEWDEKYILCWSALLVMKYTKL